MVVTCGQPVIASCQHGPVSSGSPHPDHFLRRASANRCRRRPVGVGRPDETRFNDARYSTAAIGSDKSNGRKDGSIRPEMVEAGDRFRSAKAEVEGSNRAEYIPWASGGNAPRIRPSQSRGRRVTITAKARRDSSAVLETASAIQKEA